MTARRSTVYFDADIHRALRLKAATSDYSISHIVNHAVRVSQAEDAEDVDAYRRRKREPAAKEMRRRTIPNRLQK